MDAAAKIGLGIAFAVAIFSFAQCAISEQNNSTALQKACIEKGEQWGREGWLYPMVCLMRKP